MLGKGSQSRSDEKNMKKVACPTLSNHVFVHWHLGRVACAANRAMILLVRDKGSNRAWPALTLWVLSWSFQITLSDHCKSLNTLPLTWILPCRHLMLFIWQVGLPSREKVPNGFQ